MKPRPTRDASRQFPKSAARRSPSEPPSRDDSKTDEALRGGVPRREQQTDAAAENPQGLEGARDQGISRKSREVFIRRSDIQSIFFSRFHSDIEPTVSEVTLSSARSVSTDYHHHH